VPVSISRPVKRPGFLSKPQFLFNPGAVARRLGRTTPGHAELRWGLSLSYSPGGFMGESLDRMGTYDLVVTETLFRLLGPGDTAVDVGANVGYMTSIMARRVGSAGRVVVFEPQPDVFSQLQRNVDGWLRAGPAIGQVELHQVALSSASAELSLSVPEDDDENHIRATLGALGAEQARSIPVQARRLDDIVKPSDRIAVMKLDAEGHELEVLRGAERSLRETSVVIFEEHGQPPTPVTELLVERGFAIYALSESLLGPRLEPLEECAAHVGWDPPSLVATRDSAWLRSALKPRGWLSLKSGR